MCYNSEMDVFQFGLGTNLHEVCMAAAWSIVSTVYLGCQRLYILDAPSGAIGTDVFMHHCGSYLRPPILRGLSQSHNICRAFPFFLKGYWHTMTSF